MITKEEISEFLQKIKIVAKLVKQNNYYSIENDVPLLENSRLLLSLFYWEKDNGVDVCYSMEVNLTDFDYHSLEMFPKYKYYVVDTSEGEVFSLSDFIYNLKTNTLLIGRKVCSRLYGRREEFFEVSMTKNQYLLKRYLLYMKNVFPDYLDQMDKFIWENL